MTEGIRRRAFRGTLWAAAANGTTDLLRLGSNLILARLLFPEAFGLMAIVNLVTTGLQMVSNVGIRPAVVRHERGAEPEFLDTAWTLQIVRGGILAAVCAALAPLLAAFYEQPQLSSLLLVAAVVPLLDGFVSTKLIRRTRDLDLGPTVAVQLGAKIGSVVVTVLFALWLRSVWVLLFGSIAMSLLQALLSHLAIPGRPDRLRWNREVLDEIVSFGRWILVSTIFGYAARRADVLLLGKLASMETLGVYSIAILFAGIPQRFFGRFAQMVLMPALSEAHRQQAGRLSDALLRSKQVVIPGSALALVACVAAAPAFFRFLYDPRYWEAGWIAQLTMLALWFDFLQDANGRAILALGDSRGFALSNAVKATSALLGCFLGFRLGGLVGLLLGLAVASLAGYAVTILFLRSHRIRLGWTELWVSVAAGALGLLCVFVPRVASEVLPSWDIALRTLVFGALLLAGPGVAYLLRARHLLAAR